MLETSPVKNICNPSDQTALKIMKIDMFKDTKKKVCKVRLSGPGTSLNMHNIDIWIPVSLSYIFLFLILNLS